MKLKQITENEWTGKCKTVEVTIFKNVLADGDLKDKFTFYIEKDENHYNSIIDKRFNTLQEANESVENYIKIWLSKK